MKPLNLQFLPLTFIDSSEKIKEQVINTVVFASLLEEHGLTNLKHYLESTQYGYTASSSEQGDYRFLRITDINQGTVQWNTVPFCSGSDVDKYLLKSNDILVARTGGTTGKSHLVANPPNNAVFASYLIRLRPEKHANPLFIDIFLNSYLFWNQVVAMKSGSAQPNVNAEKLKELILPKCDLATQNRVVEFIKNPETMGSSLKQRVATVMQKYDALNDLLSTIDWQLGLIPQLRQALLREAMQGRLLPQDPTDEPVAALLRQLQAAKAKSAKAGKRPVAPLFAEEAEPVEGPFEIPASWVWTQLGILTDYGKSDKAVPNDISDETWVLDLEDIEKDTSKILARIPFSERNSLSTKNAFSKGDVLYSKLRPYLNKVVVANEQGVCTTEILPLKCSEAILPEFLLFALKRPDFLRYVNGVTKGMKMPRLGTKEGQVAPIPLPPLAEQQRIVAKLGQLLAHCDALEQRIQESRRLAGQLLQTALREALAGPGGAGAAAEPQERKRRAAVGMTGDLFAAVD